MDLNSTYHKLYEANGEKEITLNSHEAGELLDYLEHVGWILSFRKNRIMKVRMFVWYSRPKGLPDWFIHGADKEVSWKDIQEVFDAGINVRLTHQDDIILFCVDDKGFTQR